MKGIKVNMNTQNHKKADNLLINPTSEVAY